MPRFDAHLGWQWQDRPLEQRITAAARAGFRAVETAFPYETPAEMVAELCAANDLTLLGLNTPLGDTGKGERGLGAVTGRQDDFQAAFDQALAYCVASGATAVHAMAGVAPYGEAGIEVLIDNIRRAADKAANHGLTVLLEGINQRSMPGYFYSTCEQVADAIERIGRNNVRMMFDVFHVAIAGGDVLTRLEKFLPLIGHVQIAAVPSRHEPDEGEIDYSAIFAALDELGYDGWVGCEYSPRGDTDAGLAWLDRLGAKL